MLPARAGDRQIYYWGLQPNDQDYNQQERDTRILIGTMMLHAGLTGTYADLTISPGSGLNVTVAPTAGSTNGAVYQQVADDPNPMPQATPTADPDALPADPTKIAVPAFISSATAPIGPLTAPTTSGYSMYYLIEAQVQPPLDHNLASRTFLDNLGNPSPFNVAQQRSDLISIVAKAGTAGTSPTQPTADSGYVALGWVAVANGQTSITSSNITMAPGWNHGWAQIGNAGVSPATCAFFDANAQLVSGGCNTSGGSPTTVSAGDANVSVTPSGSNYVVDVSHTPSFTSISANSAAWAGNSQITPAGVATSSQNYGSVGGFQLQSSSWTGSAPQTNTWNFAVDSSGNSKFQYNGATQFSVSPAGTVTAASFVGNGSGLTNLFSGFTNGFCVQATSTSSLGTISGACAQTSGPQTFAGLQTFSAASPFAFSSTSGATIASNATGSAVPFTWNASNASSPTGDIADYQVGGVNEVQLQHGGSVKIQGSYLAGSSTYGPASATINGGLTLNSSGAVVAGSSSYGPTGSNVNGPLNILGNNNLVVNGLAQFGAPGSAVTLQGIPCTTAGIAQSAIAWRVCVDNSSNVGVGGSVYASNFLFPSRREWKHDIMPITFDPLDVLMKTDFKQYRYRKGYGDGGKTERYGFIANDTPSVLSGAHHDHFDAAALSTVDALAILKEQREIDGLVKMVRGLCALPQNRKVPSCVRR